MIFVPLHISLFDCEVGPSGAGKSTLSMLLLRMYDPNSGCVTLNGTDLRELNSKSYRKHIGVHHSRIKKMEKFSMTIKFPRMLFNGISVATIKRDT